jgi:hypothetical protein
MTGREFNIQTKIGERSESERSEGIIYNTFINTQNDDAIICYNSSVMTNLGQRI